MKRNNYRRSSSGNKGYQILDKALPVKPSFVMTSLSIALVFIIFIMICSAAVIYGSSTEKLSAAKANAANNQYHYDAETIATEILTTLASDNGESFTDENGELKYPVGKDEITISRNGGNFSFDVPIKSTEPHSFKNEKNLHVIATITGGDINIIKWYETN